jgi:acyl carrier protein
MRSTSGESVFDRVTLAVEQTVYIDRRVLTPATQIAGDLGVGRFGRIKLVLYLEEMFDVEIPDEMVAQFDTVGDIIHYLSRRSHESTEFAAQAAPDKRRWVTA